MTGYPLLQHLPIIPILFPFLVALVVTLPWLNGHMGLQRFITQIGLLVLVAINTSLLIGAIDNGAIGYALGDWAAPFGILLIADPLSTIMLLLTSVLALAAHLYACAGEDAKGRFFHPLFMFQLMGLNGAFLTADAFNLFVFFEILLIASYSLLVHGGGWQRTKAAQHYVLYNLIGSAFFLIALAVLYRAFGTLNIPDMAQKVATLPAENAPLVQVAGGLLLVVFGVKAALLPMHFWLPRTYSSTSIPVAALFAVMTKVGIYSMWRIHNVIFADAASVPFMSLLPWLAGLTVVAGSVGVLSSSSLRWLIANLVIISVGTLLMTVSIGTEATIAAGIFYCIHSTLMCGAFFLLSGVLSQQRGQAEDRLVSSKPLINPMFSGIVFVVIAMALIGLPPFSGFIGKIYLMRATLMSGDAYWVWPLILLSGLAAMIALSRAGTTIFWRHQGSALDKSSLDLSLRLPKIAVMLLAVCSPLLVIFAGPMTELSLRAATELMSGFSPVYLSGGQ
ncbi:MAG: monovalent cation/H+ antiporter subunit D [Oleibacter sp.]|nr:monovalent cation/H+ antiporter subunit D [Thalassolituus sp.]